MSHLIVVLQLRALITPHYPTGEGGRAPIPLQRMLRIYFLQQWFNLSDPGVEEALYDMVSMRTFAGIDLGDAPVPDETTVCKFRKAPKNGVRSRRTTTRYPDRGGPSTSSG